MTNIVSNPFEDAGWWRRTYIFKEFKKLDDGTEHPFFSCDIPDENDNLTFFEDAGCIVYELAYLPNRPLTDGEYNFIGKINWLYYEYFKEVFDINDNGSPGYSRIILKKDLYNEICAFLKEHNLIEYKTFFLNIIVKAQEIITGPNHGYWNWNNETKDIKRIRKTAKDLIRIIERVAPGREGTEKKRKKYNGLLQSIQFNFPDEAIKIEDAYFGSLIVDKFREYFDNGKYKNWHYELADYAAHREISYEDARKFSYRYSAALYNLFVKENFIKIKGKPYPNYLMEAIGKMLKYSLIKIDSPKMRAGNEIKTIRNWVQHKITPRIPHESIKGDVDKLFKYFDKDFINSTTDIKDEASISIAAQICLRFGVQNITKEVLHIMCCLNSLFPFIAFLPPGINEDSLPIDVKQLNSLVDDLKAKKNITAISIRTDNTEYTFTERLPIHLIKEAVSSYYQENKIEFNAGLLDGNIKLNPVDGRVEQFLTGKMSTPENRFFVRFVDSFYNFLSAETPMKERKMILSERDEQYYLLIGLVMQNAGFFRPYFHGEQFILEKIKHWHKLNSLKEE